MSTLYGGEYHARYVHIFFDFCAFYSGCCKVAVVILVIGILLQRYLKQTNLDTEEAHHRAGLVDNTEQ
jgi:hypothetical protein